MWGSLRLAPIIIVQIAVSPSAHALSSPLARGLGLAVRINRGNSEKGHLPHFTREEVFRHRKKEDCWIVLHGKVYDVTSWLNKHPGGAKLLLDHAGEDASVSY